MKTAAKSKGTTRRFWDNKEFLKLAREFNDNPQDELMDEIAGRFFIPLATCVVSKITLHPSLDKQEVAMGGVVLCWRSFGNLDLSRSNPLSFFYRMIERYAWRQNSKAQKRARKFVSLDCPDGCNE